MTTLANDTVLTVPQKDPGRESASKPPEYWAEHTYRARVQGRSLVNDADARTTAVGQESQVTIGPQRTAHGMARAQSAEYRRFRTLQQWEGVVTKVRDDVFEAELRDLNHPSNPSEFVELSLDEVSAPDKPLLCTGSVFYWIIGYETRTGGQILNVSEVRFKRMPRWSRADLEAARKKGKELFDRFATNGEITESEPPSGAE